MRPVYRKVIRSFGLLTMIVAVGCSGGVSTIAPSSASASGSTPSGSATTIRGYDSRCGRITIGQPIRPPHAEYVSNVRERHDHVRGDWSIRDL
jgi:hypothetical protein